ncbi:hypothetical protein MKY15_19710 [Sporosarcina sp. FSL K6-1540]|uniref:hypothetical protein n=1 Tax=Sporosarcina sp. FSL K6-1540 TaxID=2921555 RepID=UPI00315A1B17
MSSKNEKSKFSKTAFIEAEANNNSRNLLQVLLKEDKTYTQDEVAKLVMDWNKKEVKG